MIDSIYIALSGMLSHERGLNVISNNVTNLNTAGFRGSTVSFSDVFVGTAPNGLGLDARDNRRSVGGGVDASRDQLDFRAGQSQNTGGELDLSLDGDGWFIVQDEQGQIRYTRAGQFDIVDDELRVKDTQLKVMTRASNGQLLPLSVHDLTSNPAKATTTVSFQGNLSPGDTEHQIESLAVYDSQGGKHTLTVVFTKQPQPTQPATTSWAVTVREDGESIGTGQLDFLSISPLTSELSIALALRNAPSANLTFDFSSGSVTGSDTGTGTSGSESTLRVQEQDGYAAGTITGRTFDAKGVMKLTYSNGQSADGPKLALARIADQSSLLQLSGGLFEYRGSQAVIVREAGDDLKVLAGVLEGSNVDLTQQFGQLILMQRGYQASSQVMSTANEMLQQLFDLGGHR